MRNNTQTRRYRETLTQYGVAKKNSVLGTPNKLKMGIDPPNTRSGTPLDPCIALKNYVLKFSKILGLLKIGCV